MTETPSSRSEGPFGPGWHAPANLLARFAAESDSIDAVTAASLETHLVSCSACRGGLATAAPLDVAASWDAVADRIDRPRASPAERLLERFGVGDGLARVVSATPALQLAGIALIAGLAAAAVLLAREVDAGGPFLVLAPLVPLAGVAATFAPAADPAGETGIATPLHGAGLALRRASVVLGTTFVLLGLVSVGVPGLGVESAAWVLPALALALGSLALGTWWRVEHCVAGLASVWLVTIASWRLVEGRDFALGESAVFTASGQLTAVAVALLAAAILATRSDRFATLEAS